MRLRTTLILLLIFLGLAGYVYFVEFDRAAEEAKKKTLFDLEQDKVTSVTLTYPDRKIAVKKVDGKWRIVEPIDDLADETAVSNLVTAIAECEVKRTFDDVPKDLATYGLDKPRAEVVVGLADRELPAIKVGKNTPVGFSTYIQRADDPKVHLTTSAFQSGTDKQVKDLRDKQILTFQDDQVRTITVQGEQGTVVLKKTDGAWALEQPAAQPADVSAVRGFLSSLRSLRATDFAAEDATDLTSYGLDRPRVSVTLVGEKADEQKQILIGGETDKKDIYVKVGGRPTIYTAGSWVLRDLNKTANDFRDKTIVAFEPDAVTGIELQYDHGSALVLTRKDKDNWTAGGSDAVPEAAKVTQFLTELKDLKGYEIATDMPASLEQYGLAPPQVSVTLRGKDTEIATVRLGAIAASGEAKTKEYTAQQQGQPTVFRIREFQFNKLNKKPQDFFAKPTPTRGTAATPTPKE